MKKLLLNTTLSLLAFMAASGANTFSVLGMHQPKKPECLRKKLLQSKNNII